MRKFALSATRLLKDRPTTTKDYEWYISDFPKELTVDEFHYEVGKKNGLLHIHGMCSYTGKVKPTGKKIYKQGWNVVLEPSEDTEGWLTYIRKDSSNEWLTKIRHDPGYGSFMEEAGKYSDTSSEIDTQTTV